MKSKSESRTPPLAAPTQMSPLFLKSFIRNKNGKSWTMKKWKMQQISRVFINNCVISPFTATRPLHVEEPLILAKDLSVHPLLLTFFVQPIAAQCWRRKKNSEKNTILNEHPVSKLLHYNSQRLPEKKKSPSRSENNLSIGRNVASQYSGFFC